MARRTITIEEKITRAEEETKRAKKKYDACLDELNRLREKKEKIENEEILTAVKKSRRSHKEILRFLENKTSDNTNQ